MHNPRFVFSLLLLSFNLSLYHSLSLSLQFRSPHPCSREINPRSPTSVEREQSVILANCGSSCRVDSGGRPARRTLPHHSPTGHWAPQPQLPRNNCRLSASLKWLLLHISLVSNAESFTRQCLPTCFLSQNIAISCCPLRFCLGTKPERPSSTSNSSFCADPPNAMQCSQT